MISSLAKRYWLLSILLIPLACGIPESSSFKTVTFRVIPKSLPPASKIYLTGNHSRLGNWQPNVASLHEQSDGSWSRRFSFHRGTHLEFKIIRGNWESEAVNVDGIEFPNYVLEVGQDTTLVIEISHWRDTFKRATFLSARRLSNKGGNLELLENWKYRAGDNPEWANAAYNDSAWEEVDPCLPPKQLPKSGWDGIGWFRLHLTVDSTLWNVPLAMYMVQTGASEVYLNGRLLYQYGKVGTCKEAETALQDPNPKHIMFGEQTQHVLAVRYSNHATRWYNRLGMGAGFECQLGELNSYIADRANRVRQSTVYQMVFTTAFAAFAFAHLLLFMSDGYPELFNQNNEMLDYPRIGEIFREAAPKPAIEVIAHLWKAGEAWANGNPLNDDTTLLVIKVKEDEHGSKNNKHDNQNECEHER